MERLNPTNDFLFKKIFGEEGCEEELRAFLNAVLEGNSCEQLTTLEIMEDKELTKEQLLDKTGRLDVKAKTADGTQYNIEIQLVNQKNMEKRTLFYWGRLFMDNIKAGENYKVLPRTITINLLDYELLETDKFHSTFMLWENDERLLLTDVLEIHMIELPKFRQEPQKDKLVPLHRWLNFLDPNIEKTDLEELMEMDDTIKKAEKKLEYYSADERTRALIRAREDSARDLSNIIESAEENGFEKGLEKGREEGQKESRKIMVKRMIKKGMDENAVCEITGLTIEEIRELMKG